jgi:hypothetical protein
MLYLFNNFITNIVAYLYVFAFVSYQTVGIVVVVIV